MKTTWNKAAWALLATPLLFASCDKEDTGKLEGAIPASGFTTTSRSVGLTTEVTFTATNQDGFLYQWEFGDGTVGSGKQVTHVYSKGGPVMPRLITAYRSGTSVSEQQTIVLPEVTDIVKNLLTGGSSRTWKLDNTANAPIVVGTEANPSEYFAGVKAGELPACQSDDEYTFSTNNVLKYDAKGETFTAGSFACLAPQTGDTNFTFGAATGAGFAQLTLARAGAFIGTTDASPTEQVYRILAIDNQKMTLRAGSGRNNGTVFTIKLAVK
ncbi:PKD domain-containing protein [Hymenobacter sp. HSC-4F20]|uniref:PKD domain-containing protein n=1 Tax=Hymenobacter sp. HSC-4F20 TaxID=2864135 RepID=UPI001C733B84|nr:PKD domain-containing protein [Hymenobacter sp. HSC-4F20]MBX0291840.1 PKD domain-containing protein [Hymenobacter sp. HSC-4F20]